MTHIQKDKDRLQMYVSLTKITIALCWLSLIAFWLIKIFGGNWFAIMVENENFIKFSNAGQNTWLKYLVSLFTISISYYLIFGAVMQKFLFKGKMLIIVIFSILSNWAIVNFCQIDIIRMAYGYFILSLSGIIFQKSWKKLLGLLAVGLDFCFVTISMFVRSIQLNFLTNYLVILILSIDVYIMFALYYFYSNLIRLRKEC